MALSIVGDANNSEAVLVPGLASVEVPIYDHATLTDIDASVNNELSGKAPGVLVMDKSGTSINISGISKASAAVVTATSHGLAVGELVTFASVGGMTEINGLTAEVTVVTDANTVTVDIDSSNFTAYTSGGTMTVYDYTLCTTRGTNAAEWLNAATGAVVATPA